MGDRTEAVSEDRTSEEGMMEIQPDGASRKVTVVVDRPIYTQSEFDRGHDAHARNSKTFRERVRGQFSKCACSAQCLKSFFVKIFPFIRIMKKYRVKEDLPSDIVSGLTIGIMHIPQGMAYAMLAEQAPIYGLYVSFFPVLLYFLLGTSKHISLGTFAVVSLMIGATVTKNQASFCGQYVDGITGSPSVINTTESPVNTYTMSIAGLNLSTVSPGVAPSEGISELDQCKAKIAAAVTLMAGAIQLGMGLLRLGFLTIYLSDPLTRGFTTGAAMHVFTSQVKHIFGLDVARFSGPFKLIYSYIDMFSKITQTNWAALIIAVICMVILYLTKEYINPHAKRKIKMPVPIELLVVVIATMISYFANFHEKFNIKVVGAIPRGIPPPRPPPPQLLSIVAGDAVAMSIVAFAISVSMAKLFAQKHSYEVDANQEMVAYGITNSVSSFFNCFASAASLSRSLVQEGAGGRTQVAGLVSCSLILIVLLAVGPLFQQLPNAVLAAIILVALKGMFLQLKDLKKLWFINKYDFAVWLVVYLSTTILDVDYGLMIGVAFSLLTVVFRTQRPYTCLLGRVPHTDLYKDKSVYDSAQEVAGIQIYRFEAALYYANRDHFIKKLFKKCGLDPRKLQIQQTKIETRRKKEQQNQVRRRQKAQNKEGAPVDLDGHAEIEAMYPMPMAPIHHVIIDCATMGFIDSMGVNTLSQIIKDYDEVGVTVLLASCKAGIREQLEAAGFFQKIERERLYLSIHDAVLAALEKHPTLLEQISDDCSLRKVREDVQTPFASRSFNNDASSITVIPPTEQTNGDVTSNDEQHVSLLSKHEGETDS